jgi:hypothetical protein
MSVLAVLIYSFYKLFISGIIYPYSLLFLASIIALGMFFSLNRIKHKHKKIHLVFTVLGILNCGLLLLDYTHSDLLKNTWNISIALFFAIIIYSLLDRVHAKSNLIAKITYFVTLITGIVVVISLLGKLSSPIIFSTAIYLFGITTLLNLLLIFFKKELNS